MQEFAILVRDMREAQKLYFKHRSSLTLEKARSLERKVDDYLRKLNLPNNGGPKQSQMFN